MRRRVNIMRTTSPNIQINSFILMILSAFRSIITNCETFFAEYCLSSQKHSVLTHCRMLPINYFFTGFQLQVFDKIDNVLIKIS